MTFSVRSGYVSLDHGSMKYTDFAGVYWSMGAYSNQSYAYFLHFSNAGAAIYSSNASNRYFGFSLRCLQE